jgi:hypothetical protein
VVKILYVLFCRYSFRLCLQASNLIHDPVCISLLHHVLCSLCTQLLRHSSVSQMELKSRLYCLIIFPVVLTNTDSFISNWSCLLIKFSFCWAISAFFLLDYVLIQRILLYLRLKYFPRVLCFIRLVIIFWSGFLFFATDRRFRRTHMLCIQAVIPVSRCFDSIFVTVPYLCSWNAVPSI